MRGLKARGAWGRVWEGEIFNMKTSALTPALYHPSAFAALRRDKMGEGEVVPASGEENRFGPLSPSFSNFLFHG
jgi:hypothetical protein